MDVTEDSAKLGNAVKSIGVLVVIVVVVAAAAAGVVVAMC